jgi:photosystem II stability/assembly factor-like uncharacterized protein
MDSEDDLASHSINTRAWRALTLIAASILAIIAAASIYAHTDTGFVAGWVAAPAPKDKPAVAYQLAAVDFVTPAAGWVVADFGPHGFAVLHTTDAGDHWSRQLSTSAGGIGEYERFFDPSHGVVVSLGQRGIQYQTRDGGKTWGRQALTLGDGYIFTADFVDPNHGWLLAQASTVGELLFRTEDGGKTWSALGSAVLDEDWAYGVAFADPIHGWLYSQSAGAYAYKSDDAGTTWHRVALPAPPASRSAASPASASAEKFFVAVNPTEDGGLTATLVDGAPPTSLGPLGAAPIYPADLNAAPAKLVQLSSVDAGRSWNPISSPSTNGTIGYIDAFNWWWIGSGARSTSSDAGRSWSPIRTVGVPEPLPGSLHFTDATHAWFGAMGGTRPVVENTDDGGLDWTMIPLPSIPEP